MLEGVADAAGIVISAGKAHMIADRKALIPAQPHESGDHVNALLPVSIRQRIVVFERIDALPFSVDLDVALAWMIDIDLAQIVKQGNHGDRLIADLIEAVDALDPF